MPEASVTEVQDGLNYAVVTNDLKMSGTVSFSLTNKDFSLMSNVILGQLVPTPCHFQSRLKGQTLSGTLLDSRQKERKRQQTTSWLKTPVYK